MLAWDRVTKQITWNREPDTIARHQPRKPWHVTFGDTASIVSHREFSKENRCSGSSTSQLSTAVNNRQSWTWIPVGSHAEQPHSPPPPQTSGVPFISRRTALLDTPPLLTSLSARIQILVFGFYRDCPSLFYAASGNCKVQISLFFSRTDRKVTLQDQVAYIQLVLHSNSHIE